MIIKQGFCFQRINNMLYSSIVKGEYYIMDYYYQLLEGIVEKKFGPSVFKILSVPKQFFDEHKPSKS